MAVPWLSDRSFGDHGVSLLRSPAMQPVPERPRDWRGTARRPQRRISAVLRRLSASANADLTVGEAAEAFGNQAFGAFIVLFGALNLIPLPPGASFVAGVPLCVVSLQLAFGRHSLWLPERVRQARLPPSVIGKLMTRLGRPLRRIERLARHRCWPKSDVLLATAIGWFTLLLAVPVIIPLPLTNILPGIGIALLGLGLTARDGLWLAVGFVAGILALIALGALYGVAILGLLQIA